MCLLIVALALALPSRPAAHEIPGDVTVQALVKPEGARLRVLVRVLQDFNFPQRGPTSSSGRSGAA